MDLMCEWVKYFNINLYVPTYAYFARSCAGNICILFTSLLHLCLHFWWCYMSFFPHLVPSTLHGLNSRVTRSALFIIVYLERTCFIRQAMLPWPIDSKASVDWIVEWGDGKRRKRERKSERNHFLPSTTFNMICIKLLCWAFIDKRNMDFRQSQTPDHLPLLSPTLASCIRR